MYLPPGCCWNRFLLLHLQQLFNIIVIVFFTLVAMVLLSSSLSVADGLLVLLIMVRSSWIKGWGFNLASEFFEFLLVGPLLGLSVFCYFLVFLLSFLKTVLPHFFSVFQINFAFFILFLSFLVYKFGFLLIFLLNYFYILSSELMHHFQRTLSLGWWYVRCTIRLLKL